ncbi:hypothetical protein K435DRAFT_838809 [Dendrothele bispora CBS 962.96]|uniref:Uncharacterized protein n=1 Tax=Dendrothele bispora (strain CBS 962.96) TaxID=1314807 RepID=A0A4S8M4S2_DENBC|nr:hypothetical protein K435DRAFT_838809 [Dendrothele bispora CBS 962.96]
MDHHVSCRALWKKEEFIGSMGESKGKFKDTERGFASRTASADKSKEGDSFNHLATCNIVTAGKHPFASSYNRKGDIVFQIKRKKTFELRSIDPIDRLTVWLISGTSLSASGNGSDHENGENGQDEPGAEGAEGASAEEKEKSELRFNFLEIQVESVPTEAVAELVSSNSEERNVSTDTETKAEQEAAEEEDKVIEGKEEIETEVGWNLRANVSSNLVLGYNEMVVLSFGYQKRH